MAVVPDNVRTIRTATYGEQVREAIADSLEQCYAYVTLVDSISVTHDGNGNVTVTVGGV